MAYSIESSRELDGQPGGDAAREAVVGRECDDSGTGLGIREVGWSFKRLAEARKVARKLKAQFPGDSIVVWHHECRCYLCGDKDIFCEEIHLTSQE